MPYFSLLFCFTLCCCSLSTRAVTLEDPGTAECYLTHTDNPGPFSFKTQQFISFFRHSHLFQLKCPALWLHAALSSTNKTVSKSTIQVQFRFSISVQLRGNGICINDFYVSLCLFQQFIEIVIFCLLLYLYKRRNMKHIVIVMLLVALLGTKEWKLPD